LSIFHSHHSSAESAPPNPRTLFTIHLCPLPRKIK
jgi:hypothetical protein